MTAAATIDALLDESGIDELVGRYFDPSTGFAGHTFDDVGENPDDRFTEGDLLAVTLLDVRCGPLAVRQLLHEDRWTTILRRLSTTRTLWQMTPSDYDVMLELWTELRTLQGIGGTKASKLMARKRPNLVPIHDSVVAEFYGPPTRTYWWDLHDALQDERRRRRIDDLGAGVNPTVPTLRLLDVAIWMRRGGSRNARSARAAQAL